MLAKNSEEKLIILAAFTLLGDKNGWISKKHDAEDADDGFSDYVCHHLID